MFNSLSLVESSFASGFLQVILTYCFCFIFTYNILLKNTVVIIFFIFM